MLLGHARHSDRGMRLALLLLRYMYVYYGSRSTVDLGTSFLRMIHDMYESTCTGIYRSSGVISLRRSCCDAVHDVLLVASRPSSCHDDEMLPAEDRRRSINNY